MNETIRTNGELYDKVSEDINLSIENIVILVCAIVIASIGLNMNSQPVLIGAMLISPMMAPVLGLGMGFSVFDSRMARRALKVLFFEVGFAVLAATIYFYFSPITYASSEILARTNPTIWDLIIAFFGGVAGIVGARKKEANNIVPGVAIATALLPPLCVVGYGLATWNLTYLLGAGYLFFLNVAFIIIATFISIRILRVPLRKTIDPTISRRRQLLLLGAAVIVAIPSFYSAGTLVQETYQQQQAQRFISKELAGYYLLSEDIDVSKQEIYVNVVGEEMTNERITGLEDKLSDYQLGEYHLVVNQIADKQGISLQELDQYIRDEYADSESQSDPNEEKDKVHTWQEAKDFILKEYPEEIRSIQLVEGEGTQQIMQLRLQEKVTTEQQEEIKVSLEKEIKRLGIDDLSSELVK